MTRQVLWVFVVSSSAALYAACSPCVSSGKPAGDPVPPPKTLVDGGLGDPCENSYQCESGLDCRPIYAATDTWVVDSTFNACTRDCSTTACPQGFSCDTTDGGSSHCRPACANDADCQGKREGHCEGAADGGSADGGAATGRCEVVVCGGDTSTGTCGTGYTCQGDRYGGGGGCYANGNAAIAAPRGGWCGK